MITRRAMLQRLMVMSFLFTVFRCAGYAQQSQSPLPAPTGPYAVGRTLFNWIDESRVDLLNPKGYREIPVWVWYPASPVFGHSIGATATAQVAKDDSRVRAAILLDGTLMGDVVRNPIIPKPLLLMSASSFKGKERQPGLKGRNDVMNTLLHNAKPSYVVTIAGTTHSFPADTGLMPFAKDWQGQSANPSRAMMITRAYVKAFFDQHLLGKASSLLNGPAPEYPEVTFENAFEQK